jgi:hypothetical protein
MQKLIFAFAAAVAMILAAASYAEKPTKEAEMKNADKDSDGKVTVAEYVAYYKLTDADGQKADKNGDGIIEVDEFVIIAHGKQK